MASGGNRAAPGPRPFRKRGSVRCPCRRFPPRLGAGRAPGPLSSVAGVLHFWPITRSAGRSAFHGAPDGAPYPERRTERLTQSPRSERALCAGCDEVAAAPQPCVSSGPSQCGSVPWSCSRPRFRCDGAPAPAHRSGGLGHSSSLNRPHATPQLLKRNSTTSPSRMT
jgi:hypothetical protein